jgi:hypothetical protein
MTILHLHGRITAEGKLDVTLPADVMPGEVEVIVQPVERTVADEDAASEVIEPTWTLEEVQDFLRPRAPEERMTYAELVDWIEAHPSGWESMGITDSSEWVLELRRRIDERRDGAP